MVHLKKFQNLLEIYFGKFSLKIWPFFQFENLAFFETPYFIFWDLVTLMTAVRILTWGNLWTTLFFIYQEFFNLSQLKEQ